MSSKRKFISIKTTIPGPVAKELLKKKEKHVPKGPFNTMLTFAEKGDGALLTDVDGNTFIDLAGAIGSLNVGHCPPQVVNAIKNQAEHYIHTSFHVMMYESYIKLAETLNELTPGDYPKKTFFMNSGAEAVENAIKIARKFTGRKAILSFDRGFHGRTYMSMSLTSKVKPYKYEFGPFVPETYKLPYPYYYRSNKTEREVDNEILANISDFFLGEVPPEEVAAFILEPVQGEGGFVIPSTYFVQELKKICEQYGILLIADEVQTGFGRTGRYFAMEHFDVMPDLITMSKSIAAGFPISAVTGKSEIMDAAGIGEIGGTYGGSPLGCVAALEVIKMIKSEGLLERSTHIGKVLITHFKRLKEKYPFIGDVRGLGAMVAIELIKPGTNKIPAKEVTSTILKKVQNKGVILMGAGLYGNVIRVLSPLVITDEQLLEALDVIEEVVSEEFANIHEY